MSTRRVEERAPAASAEPLSSFDPIAVGLSAVIVTATEEEPRVLVVRAEAGEGLPSGPLEPQHRTLETGLRAWVATQTRQALGYVEQLYTFGDRGRLLTPSANARVLSIGYLALVREAAPGGSVEAEWRDWYRYFPWEDWRAGRPDVVDRIQAKLKRWCTAAENAPERKAREARSKLGFAEPWNEDRVLERYELLYEAGLVAEAHRDGTRKTPGRAAKNDIITDGEAMMGDHRRILATAIARLRGKIKYRPVVFELMPPSFSLLRLQLTVEALSGVRLHKPNFRRLVESQGLVEETGETMTETGGRPARLVRFRREVLVERPSYGVRLPKAKSAS